MLERQERLALMLLISVVIVVGASHLILSALGKGPFASPYSDQTGEGSLVVLEGTVEQVTTTREGGHRILQVKGVPVFLPATVASAITVLPGDTIRVYGVAQTYQGEREVLVNSAADITLLPQNAASGAPPGEGRVE